MASDHLMTSNWTVVAALASPHLLYAFIWFYPDQWMKAFKKGSVQAFESAAWALKGDDRAADRLASPPTPRSRAAPPPHLPRTPTAALQFSSVAYWYLTHRPAGFDPAAVALPAWAAALALGAAGQALNVGIFRAIGHAGVYYGFKLGHSVPWVDGFPFNVVRHPQYVGSVLSVWAAVALLWTQAPSGLALLAAYWTTLYVITGWMESSLPA